MGADVRHSTDTFRYNEGTSRSNDVDVQLTSDTSTFAGQIAALNDVLSAYEVAKGVELGSIGLVDNVIVVAPVQDVTVVGGDADRWALNFVADIYFGQTNVLWAYMDLTGAVTIDDFPLVGLTLEPGTEVLGLLTNEEDRIGTVLENTKDGFVPFEWGDGEGADASEVTVLSRGSDGPDVIHNFQVDHDSIAFEGALLESLTQGGIGYVVLGLETGVGGTGISPAGFDLSLDGYAVLEGGEGLSVAQLGDASAVSGYVSARLDMTNTTDNGELNATIFVMTANDDPTRAAIWAHQQSEAGDGTVDALELNQLAELNLIGGAFTAENFLPQPEVAEAGMEFDVDTDKVVLRSPLAARTIVDLETTTLAAPYVGPYRVAPDMDVSLESLELTFDFGFTGNDWETVTLEEGSIEIEKISGDSSGYSYPFEGVSSRTAFETADAFYALFHEDHVTGYRIEGGKFIVKLDATIHYSEPGLTELSVDNFFTNMVQVRDDELLPTVDLTRDEFALVSSSESTLNADDIGDPEAVATLLNTRFAFSGSAADVPRSTIFAVTAKDQPDQVAFWEHRQSQAADGSVSAEELVFLGRFTTVNGELRPENMAPVVPLPLSTLFERDSFPLEDWALVGPAGGRVELDSDDDDGRFASMAAVNILSDSDRGVDIQISNRGVDDFLAGLRSMRIEVTGDSGATAEFDISASNASSVAGTGANFLSALESITVINSARGDITVSISVTGGDYFMQSLRSIHLETTLDGGNGSIDLSISNSQVSGLFGEHFMPALETITIVSAGVESMSVSISNSGGHFFMQSLKSILVEGLRDGLSLSISNSSVFGHKDKAGGHDFMRDLETIAIHADGHDSSVSLSISNSGGDFFMKSLKSILIEGFAETVNVSISNSANFAAEGGRGEHFMSALETIVIRSGGADSSISLSISHSGGAYFMQSLRTVLLEAGKDVDMSIDVSHNFLGADNFQAMRSLETIVLRADVGGNASLDIDARHADFFMESLKSVLVESEKVDGWARFQVSNDIESFAADNWDATQQGDDFMAALETITVRGEGDAEVSLSNHEGDRFMASLQSIVAEGGRDVKVILGNSNGHDFMGALASIEMDAGRDLELSFVNVAGDRYATALDGVAFDGGGALQLSMSNQSGADFLTSFSLIDLSGREGGSSSNVNTGGTLDHALEIRVGGGDLTYDNGAVFDTLGKIYTDLGNDAQETFTFAEDDQGLLDFGIVVIKGFNWTDSNAAVRDVLDFSEAGIGLEKLDWAVDTEVDGLAHLRITSEEFAGEIVLEGNFTNFVDLDLQAFVQTQLI